MSSRGGSAPPAPLSGAALTDEEEAPPPAAGPPYEPGGLLGRGGMGEVRIARDRHLGRDVALKTAHPGDPSAARRLVREAALTARLEHPNIVPVYAAGHDAAGHPWYAMRRLPGRALAALLAATPLGPDRLRLVRHVLDAALGIAHAHERGVIHRDIKPANLMVGPQGETVVADWGLAITAEEAHDAPRAGTPGYMAPEQARRGPLDGRVDVYGLGAVLYELLAGQPPPAQGPPPPVRGAPPELLAIAQRALKPDPADRYESARAFADDLLAWFEGRRVSAHQYSAGERLGRLLHRFRLPLLVAAVGLAALSLTVAWALRQSIHEQRQARASEAVARAAQGAAETSLTAALAAQAVTAARAGRPMDAEILAAHALLHGPSAPARGILARFARQPRFTLLDRGPTIAPCARAELSPQGARMLCLTPEEALLFDPFRPAGPLARSRAVYSDAAFDGAGVALLIDEDRHLLRWAPPDPPVVLPLGRPAPTRLGTSDAPGRTALFGSGTELLVDSATGATLASLSCGVDRKGLTARVSRDGALLVGCSDHRVLSIRPGEAVVTLDQTTPDEGPPTALGDGADGRIWLATLGGVVRPVDRSAPALQVGRQSPVHLDIADTTGAMTTEEGLVVVWSLAEGRELARLHDRPGPAVWRIPDRVLRTATDHAEERQVPTATALTTLNFHEGVGALAIAPQGDRFAVGLGDGTVGVFDLANGAPRWRTQHQPGVIKDLAWSLDGATLALATVTTDRQLLLDGATGALRGALPGTKLRRILALPQAGWLLSSYDPTLLVLGEGGPATTILDQSAFDIEPAPGGAVIGTITNDIYRLTDGLPPRLHKVGGVYDLRSVAALGEETLVGALDGITLFSATGEPLRRWPSHSAVNELATSPDGRFFASGHHTGEVYLWRRDQDQPVAAFIGHGSRVNALAFSPDGQTLLSGSWDLTVRAWDLRVIEADPQQLRETVESAWGRDLERVLSSVY